MSQMIVAIRLQLPSLKRWVHDLRASRLYDLFCECLDGSPQPLLHHDFRFITQKTMRLGNISQRMTYVASPRSCIIHLCFDACDLLQEAYQMVQSDALATAYIAEASRRFHRSHSQHVGLDHIFDVGEVPGLFTIAVDSEELLCWQLGN